MKQYSTSKSNPNLHYNTYRKQPTYKIAPTYNQKNYPLLKQYQSNNQNKSPINQYPLSYYKKQEYPMIHNISQLQQISQQSTYKSQQATNYQVTVEESCFRNYAARQKYTKNNHQHYVNQKSKNKASPKSQKELIYQQNIMLQIQLKKLYIQNNNLRVKMNTENTSSSIEDTSNILSPYKYNQMLLQVDSVRKIHKCDTFGNGNLFSNSEFNQLYKVNERKQAENVKQLQLHSISNDSNKFDKSESKVSIVSRQEQVIELLESAYHEIRAKDQRISQLESQLENLLIREKKSNISRDNQLINFRHISDQYGKEFTIFQQKINRLQSQLSNFRQILQKLHSKDLQCVKSLPLKQQNQTDMTNSRDKDSQKQEYTESSRLTFRQTPRFKNRKAYKTTENYQKTY